MVDPVAPVRPPAVVVRSPSYGPPKGVDLPPSLPRDPFPPQFLEPGENVLASIKPRIRAFLGLPAIVLAAISLVALAGVGAEAGSSGPETALFLLFLLTFVLDTLVWSRWIGRNLLALLPLAFFLGVIVAAATSNPAAPINAAQTRAIIGGELPLFAVLEIGLPLAVFLIIWLRSFYAVTDQRVIEVTGVYYRNSQWIALADVGPITARQSMFGRRIGYGRIRFVDKSPRTGVRRGIAAAFLGRDIVGAEFFGVGEPEVLRAQLEEIIAPARRVEPPPSGDGMVAPVVPRPAPPAPPTPPAAVAPPATAPTVARCPRCATALVYVAPASRFYCPTCGRYV